jgi:hypothetical protein
MKNFVGKIALILVVSPVGWLPVEPSLARPPTILNSPGYDARLAESRKALRNAEALRYGSTTRRGSRARHVR